MGLFPGRDGLMKLGSLVRFTSQVYINHGWGIGVIIREYDVPDRDGKTHPGHYYVLTHRGEKLVADCFMEEIKC